MNNIKISATEGDENCGRPSSQRFATRPTSSVDIGRFSDPCTGPERRVARRPRDREVDIDAHVAPTCVGKAADPCGGRQVLRNERDHTRITSGSALAAKNGSNDLAPARVTIRVSTSSGRRSAATSMISSVARLAMVTNLLTQRSVSMFL